MMQIIQTYPVGQCSGGPYLKRDAYNLPYSILTPKCPTFLKFSKFKVFLLDTILTLGHFVYLHDYLTVSG